MKNLKVAGLLILILTSFYSCNKSDQPDIERSYTKSIERISNNDFEASLIEKAENYYSPREDVVAVAGSWLDVPTSGYWYYNGFDGVYIPYSITVDAVNYYSNLIDLFNANKKNVFFITAEFNYLAKVTFYEDYTSPSVNSVDEPVNSDSYDKVYVVELILSWDQYCGDLCAMWIDKKRIAVFNQSGDLLNVYLDGPIQVLVS